MSSSDDHVGQALYAFADATRRCLFEQLVVAESGLSATVLAQHFPLSRQAVVKHLRVLHEAHLVTKTRHGKEVRYQAQREALDDSAQWLADLATAWDQRLAQIKATAEAVPARNEP